MTEQKYRRRGMPPFMGFAILGFAIMNGARSFDVPIDGRWWIPVIVLAVLAVGGMLNRWATGD